MRPYILFLSLAVIALSSCSTAYKTGQTPDDVYYSPTRPTEEYVVVPQQDDRYDGGYVDYTDRYMRMRMVNPYRWSALDDYYFNNPYAYNYYGSYSNWYSPWNSYWAWNSYYNPYYISPIYIKNPVHFQAVPSRAVAFNPRSYINIAPQQNVNNKSNRNYGSYYSNGSSNGSRYNNSNSNSNRNYNYSNSGNSNTNNSGRTYTPSSSTPTRSYTPSSSSSSSSGSSRSSSSSSSSSTPTRPPR